MKYGSGLPLVAQGDTRALRDLAQAMDGAGFDYLSSGGHVLSAREGRFEGRPVPTYAGPFHDHFVLYAYLAAITERVAFIPSILILPLLPTALVAKQAAELYSLSGGRFELGVGISWNAAEYQALGQQTMTRGARLQEQVELLRKFWSEPFVSFEGRFHTVDDVGLNRPPMDIPIWMGVGDGKTQLRRMARYADGWIPMTDPVPVLPALFEAVAEEGRDPATFRVMGRVTATAEGPAAWVAAAERLQAAGVTHLTLGAPPQLPPAEAQATLIEARRVLSQELG